MSGGVSIEHILFLISVLAVPVLLAITIHEAAHGFVAWRLGDDTAKRLGRLSLNPLRHIDPFGTILLPALLLFLSGGRFVFGFAKPVPVAFGRLNNPKTDMVWVAAAGPGVNLLMALIAALLLNLAPLLPGVMAGWLVDFLETAVFFNVLLAVFNMIPIPPLDGGRVAVGLLPLPLAKRWARVERYGIPVVLLCVFVLPFLGREMGLDLNVFSWLVVEPAEWIADQILRLSVVM